MKWKGIKFFDSNEFDSPDLPGSGLRMKYDLVVKLDALREFYGKPLKVNSGFRTKAHNQKIGGKPNSAHLSGSAVDISCLDSVERFTLVKKAIELGVFRVGIAKTFLHLDIAYDLPGPAIFLY